MNLMHNWSPAMVSWAKCFTHQKPTDLAVWEPDIRVCSCLVRSTLPGVLSCLAPSAGRSTRPALLFRVEFKWRLQENRFFLVFGLIIHFMATTTKAKRCIFISRTPKCPGYRSILNKSRRYRLFSALLRSQFGPIRIPFSWLSEMQCQSVPCPRVHLNRQLGLLVDFMSS